MSREIAYRSRLRLIDRSDYISYADVGALLTYYKYDNYYKNENYINESRVLIDLANLMIEKKIRPYICICESCFKRVDYSFTSTLAKNFIDSRNDSSIMPSFIETIGNIEMRIGTTSTFIGGNEAYIFKSLAYSKQEILDFLMKEGFIENLFTSQQKKIIQSNRIKELSVINEKHSKEMQDIRSENTQLQAQIAELETQLKQAQFNPSDDTLSERIETSYLTTIGLLLELMQKPKGIEDKPPFQSQTAILNELIEQGIYGQKRTTLETRFSKANDALEQAKKK